MTGRDIEETDWLYVGSALNTEWAAVFSQDALNRIPDNKRKIMRPTDGSLGVTFFQASRDEDNRDRPTWGEGKGLLFSVTWETLQLSFPEFAEYFKTIPRPIEEEAAAA